MVSSMYVTLHRNSMYGSGIAGRILTLIIYGLKQQLLNHGM